MKQATVTFTDEEAKIINDLFRKASITGNLETLPSILNQMVQILKKLDEAFKPEQE